MREVAGRSAHDDLLFYCHSKGITDLDERKMGLFRLHTHVCLTADLDSFAGQPDLDRACLFPFRFGWCWYNFFWVKAGYMRARRVDESDDRHHFEALIGERGDAEAYRRVLPLTDRLPDADRGLPLKPWYRGEETTTPELLAAYDRYAGLASPAHLADATGVRRAEG